MSRTLLLVAIAATGCGAHPPANERALLERATSEPVSPEPQVETATQAQQHSEPPPCRRPWPDDPSDPRVGVYFLVRPRPPDEEHYWAIPVMFDGTTVTREWQGYWSLPERCEYGEWQDVPTIAMLRFRAYVSPRDRMLWALVPCLGWQEVGRFLDDGRMVSRLTGGTMRRAAVGEVAAFEAVPWDEERDAAFWACQEPYLADGDPIPEPPP